MGDRIYTFYHGINWRSPETAVELGDKAEGAMGLAVTPIDGFVSLDGNKGVPADVGADTPTVHVEALYKERSDRVSDQAWRAAFSQVITRSFGFTGSQLHMNIRSAAQGGSSAGPCEVRVQLLSANHEPLEGYGFDDADPLTTSGHDHVVSLERQLGPDRAAGLADQATDILQERQALLLPVPLEGSATGSRRPH